MSNLMRGRWAGRRGAPLGVLTVALLVALALAGGRWGGAVAQQATPAGGAAASPAAGPCLPGSGAAVPTVASAASPAAAASPVSAGTSALPELLGTPVANTLAAKAKAAAINFVNCYNAGNVDALTTLATANLFQTKFGVTMDTAATDLTSAKLPSINIMDMSNVQTYADGRASLDIIYMFGQYQYVSARWFLVMAEDNSLLIDEEQLQKPSPEGDTVKLLSFGVDKDKDTGKVTLAFLQGDKQGNNTTAPADIIDLYGVNSVDTRHIIAVYMLPAAVAATPVASMSDLPTGANMVGMISLGAGKQGDIALVNLPTGTYVLVDSALKGTATLTVKAAS